MRPINSIDMKKLLVLAVALLGMATSAQAQIDRPKLVVGIVVDQMRWDYLYTYNDMNCEMSSPSSLSGLAAPKDNTQL